MKTQGRTARTLATLRELSRKAALDAIAMYTLALASELPVILLRCTLVSALAPILLAPILLAATGHSIGHAAWFEIAAIPTLWSMLALATPAGTGWWFKQRSGGRRASQREQEAYRDAIELLQSQTRTALPLPKSWFVLDTPMSDAGVCGETLMLSRGLLESEHLPAVLAHELGHLASADGRLTAALDRLVLIPPRIHRRQPDEQRPQPRQPGLGLVLGNARILLGIVGVRLLARTAGTILTLMGGGLGLWLTRPLWGAYWRRHEYDADAYAATLGQGEDLAVFLEDHALIHDHPVPYIWLSEHTHPPAELRIEKLRDHGQRETGSPVRYELSDH